MVLENVIARGYKPRQIEKFIQELAWREYFQRVAQVYPTLIYKDVKQPQQKVSNHAIPTAAVQGQTGIQGIDDAIAQLYNTGYMHNHCRMYVASLMCNIARCHWLLPSRWMYYHLLDADFASNACSWQWVAGAFSHKKYYADQQNINRYCFTNQHGSFLDVTYTLLETMPVPPALSKVGLLALDTPLPKATPLTFDGDKPTLIYNMYNLDPLWRNGADANRLLLLEPSHFDTLPVSEKTIGFILQLSKNIKGIQLYVGEFADLQKQYPGTAFIFKEHPLFAYYNGKADGRDWMFPEVQGYYPSFFSFWKKCEQYLKHYTIQLTLDI
jgi:deoxyribodipyrimidine photo-lyase